MVKKLISEQILEHWNKSRDVRSRVFSRPTWISQPRPRRRSPNLCNASRHPSCQHRRRLGEAWPTCDERRTQSPPRPKHTVSTGLSFVKLSPAVYNGTIFASRRLV